MTKKIIVTWGNNHSKNFDNLEDANNFAYEKAFYFSDVQIDGVEYKRIF